MRGLTGKTALITGGVSGLGKGIVERFVVEGVHCLVIDRDAEGGGRLIETVGADKVAFAAADISDYGAVQAAVKSLTAGNKGIDILVNNAGWDKPVNFLDTDPEFWKKVIDINLYGPINLHHIVVPGMVERGGGKVINIASDAGRVGSSGESVYSACKGGIIAFTKTLCRELARKGVVLNTVCPGPSDTPLLASFADTGEAGVRLMESLKRAIPLKRLGTPEDVAGMVAFLASADADFIVGQTISVSGGLTMHG
ncbi:MAG: SDR family oxidoreductase [Proteobacteria bacterium]|nr:SDR family oxidoreductase [Pseudomonadota bacterium]